MERQHNEKNDYVWNKSRIKTKEKMIVKAQQEESTRHIDEDKIERKRSAASLSVSLLLLIFETVLFFNTWQFILEEGTNREK